MKPDPLLFTDQQKYDHTGICQMLRHAADHPDVFSGIRQTGRIIQIHNFPCQEQFSLCFFQQFPVYSASPDKLNGDRVLREQRFPDISAPAFPPCGIFRIFITPQAHVIKLTRSIRISSPSVR